jgi:hypothetical protein
VGVGPIVRLIGWIFLLSGSGVLGAEVVAWLQTRVYTIRTGRDVWQSADIASYSWAQDHWPGWLWAITEAVLTLPLAILLLIIAMLFFTWHKSLQPRRVFF